MALDQNFLTVTYDGNTSEYKVVVNNNSADFERNKEYYTFKMTATMGGLTDTFEYHITSENGNIPCIVLGGDANAGNPWGCPFFSSWGSTQSTLSAFSSMGDNFDVVLDSHTGNTFESLRLFGGRILSNITPSEVGTNNILIEIDADFPILMGEPELVGSDPNYVEYRPTQDNDLITDCYDICTNDDWTNINKAINGFEIIDSIPQNKVYFIKNILKKNGSVVEGKHYRFRIPPGAKIWFVKTEHDNTGQSYNMKLHMNGLGLVPTFLYMNMASADPEWQTAHILTSTLSDYYWGEWTDFANGDWYKVVGNSWAGYTNIPVFKDDVTGNKYGAGEIGEDAAENAGEGGGDGNITTGDDLDSSDVPSISIAGSGVGCNVWALSLSDLNTIANILHDDDQTLIEDIKKGTWLWGNNPIDFIISVYYVPFNVSTFYDTESSSLFFGSYDTGEDFTRVRESKSSGQRAILVDTTIDQVYGDWRDLDFFKYDLYLPYIGFVPLDPVVYVGHTLKVELAFDVMTHNIRYYLYSDGTLTDRVDGSVGYSVPLTGTDQVNKANNNLNGIINSVKGGVDTIKGVATGNIGDMASGALSTFNGVRQMMQYPREIIRGDISASMNIFDINYIYLKITEKQSVYPPEIREVYNNPSYVCCKLSELSGYCELQDVQLKSSCTEVEYAEILQLLKEGVIF